MKILLVEDQDLERRRTKELLETNGFVIDQASRRGGSPELREGL